MTGEGGGWRLEQAGRATEAELAALADSTLAGWPTHALEGVARDIGPCAALVAAPDRVEAWSVTGDELLGAVAWAADERSARLHGAPAGRLTTLAATGPDVARALLERGAAEARARGWRTLDHYAFEHFDALPRGWVEVSRGVALGARLDTAPLEHHRHEAPHPPAGWIEADAAELPRVAALAALTCEPAFEGPTRERERELASEEVLGAARSGAHVLVQRSTSDADGATGGDADGSVAGFCLVIPSSTCAYLSLLGVSASCRRRGVGAALVRSALAWSSARRLRMALLATRQDNAAARRLYAAAGFTELGELRFVQWRG